MMPMHSMPGFVVAMRDAMAMRTDLPAIAWRCAANTTRREFARLRITPSMVIRWAEFHAMQRAA